MRVVSVSPSGEGWAGLDSATDNVPPYFDVFLEE
jgi:hypothetical protein